MPCEGPAKKLVKKKKVIFKSVLAPLWPFYLDQLDKSNSKRHDIEDLNLVMGNEMHIHEWVTLWSNLMKSKVASRSSCASIC